MFVYVQDCVRITCARTELRMCWYEYKTMNALLANVYAKRDIENPFLGTQMFVQTGNNEYEYNKERKNSLNN